MVEISIQAFGLNIDQLHNEGFPYNSRNTNLKRQYVYGRALAPPQQANQDSGPPFQMNTMFSSAMGNKLKRLVSNIDDKMQDENGESKKSDEGEGHLMMMKKKSTDNQHRERPIYGLPIQGNSPDDKRFVGLNEQGLQEIQTRNENNDQIPNEEASVNDPRTLWMDGENDVYGVPPGVEKRQGSQQMRIFHKHNGVMNNRKKSNNKFWFDRLSAKTSVAEKDEPRAEEVQKKDAETADDFQFFQDDGEVMKELKRVFDDKPEEERPGKEEKSEEQRKMEEQHEELMDEYMKYIAQATSIKKRSPVPVRKQEQWYEMNQAEDINERLEEIERIILDEANDIMREERPVNPNEIETEVMNRVRAANDLDNIRNSILDLQDTMYEIRSEDMQQPNDVYVAEKRGKNAFFIYFHLRGAENLKVQLCTMKYSFNLRTNFVLVCLF